MLAQTFADITQQQARVNSMSPADLQQLFVDGQCFVYHEHTRTCSSLSVHPDNKDLSVYPASQIATVMGPPQRRGQEVFVQVVFENGDMVLAKAGQLRPL